MSHSSALPATTPSDTERKLGELWECVHMAQELLAHLVFVSGLERGKAPMFLEEAIKNACILTRDEALAYAEEERRVVTPSEPITPETALARCLLRILHQRLVWEDGPPLGTRDRRALEALIVSLGGSVPGYPPSADTAEFLAQVEREASELPDSGHSPDGCWIHDVYTPGCWMCGDPDAMTKRSEGIAPDRVANLEAKENPDHV